MANDPLMLQYLQDIRAGMARVEDKLDGQGERIGSLEETRAKQRGVMVAGGAFVAVMSGLMSFLARLGGH